MGTTARVATTLMVIVPLLWSCQDNKTRASNLPPTGTAAGSEDEEDTMAMNGDSSSPSMTASVPMFGDVLVSDGELVVMDGGVHGVQGHTLRLGANGTARWESRIDSFQPAGKPGAGFLELFDTERSALIGAREGLWNLAKEGKAEYSPPIEEGVPRWVWAIVLRRGEEIRILHGGGMALPGKAPPAAREVLEVLVAAVDREASRSDRP